LFLIIPGQMPRNTIHSFTAHITVTFKKTPYCNYVMRTLASYIWPKLYILLQLTTAYTKMMSHVVVLKSDFPYR
jgi:hypothetical protein